MTVTDPQEMGSSVLARRWRLDVNTGTTAIPVWTPVAAIMDFKPKMDPSNKDDSDYSSGGYKSTVITALGWGCDVKLARKTLPDDATSYDEGQEALRTVSKTMGALNRKEIRFYEMEPSGPRVEAYQGFCGVAWSEDGGDQETNATISLTLSGKGILNSITHPATAAVPTVVSLSPATGGTAGGELVLVTGTNFAGIITDGVLFGAGAAEFYVLNSCQLLAVAPAHAGGTVAVSVENATGLSTVTANYVYA